MPQLQYTTYQSDILSFELRDALVGIIKPGRYIGYDDMSQNTPPAAGDIILDFDHTNGMTKYDQTNPTPVLEGTRGIAVTTQGVVIAEDQTITQTLTFIDNVGGGYHILYMEHAYLTGVPGANAATYGIKSGAGGGGIPALDFPTKQVIIGVIKEAPNGAVFGDLAYYIYHPGVGDVDIHDKLFRSATANRIYDEGALPADGIIGDRNFSSNEYITDDESLTAVLGDLDAAILARAGDITTLQGTKLDDWDTPDDNVDLNATNTYHGLLRKLSDATDEFLRGDGTWQVPPGGRIVMRTGVFATDLSFNSVSDDTGQIDLGVGGCPADADVLILAVSVITDAIAAASGVDISFRVAAAGGFNATFRAWNNHDAIAVVYHSAQITVPCDSNQKIYYSLGNKAGISGDSLTITVVGWQTYTP